LSFVDGNRVIDLVCDTCTKLLRLSANQRHPVITERR